MIKIKNLQKKILKIMIPTFLMIFSFLFIPGVKAEEIESFCDYTEPCFSTEILDQVYENKNIDKEIYDSYVITIGNNKDSSKHIYGVYIFNSEDLNNKDIFFDINSSGNLNINFTTGRNCSFYYSTSFVSSSSKFNYLDSTISTVSVGNTMGNNLLTYDTLFFIYYTNVDLTDEDDNVLYESNINRSYEFNEDIVVTDISKIKVKFDLPEDTSNLYIDLKYKISQLGFVVGTLGDPYVSLKSIEDGIEKVSIHTEESFKNRDDIIEKMKEHVKNYYESINAIHDGSENLELLIEKLDSISKYDEYKEINIEAAIKSIFIENDELFDDLYPLALRYVDEDYCSGTYIVNLLPDSTVYEYTFEVDVYNYEGSINLNFISNLNYEIEYEYKTEIDDYLITINMKNYSALVLIPKVKNLETGAFTSIQSDIYLSGIYDIELWEDVESKNVLYRESNYSYNVFSHYQDYHYLNAILYFINKSIGDGSYYITFDSRYYNYTVKEYLAEEVEINNPNTNENIIIGDISNLYEYGNSESYKFTFNSFLKPIKFIFESISNFYNNYCPTLVQQFFYLIFMFFVVLVVIKVFL